MSLPTLSPEARANALEKAAATRRARAEFKKSVADRELTAVEALGKALDDDLLSGMRVDHFLRSLPGVGKVRAAKAQEEIGISDARRIRGMGGRQIEKLREICRLTDETYDA